MAYTAREIYPVETKKTEPSVGADLRRTVETNADAGASEIALPAQLPRSSEYLFNRDLSLIEFFRRVLEEALDESQPLLERLKFLAIFSSNLDEFFMIRVSGLKEKFSDSNRLSADGKTATEQLKAIRERLVELIDVQAKCLHSEVLPALAENGVVVASYAALTNAERESLNEYYKRNIYPVLTPQAVDPSHPFPYISGGSLNLGLMVKPKVSRRVAQRIVNQGGEIFIRIKIPPFVKRFVPVGDDGGGENSKFVPVEELIAANVQTLVPDANPADCHLFRITRDADIELREEEARDLLESMEENLKMRRFGEPVRLEVSDSMPSEMVEYLKGSLEISDEDVYVIEGAFSIADFMSLYKLDRPDLKDEPLRAQRPAVFNAGESIFEVIKRKDVLLHHPYNPYTTVIDFLEEAVEDPNVLAIKICIYRTGANSPIPPLLIKAAERGKQVTALIELKARFDEENNIEWAKRMERAGIHVFYGLLGLKTHCKTTLIVRRESDELRRYVHLATGNYNPETSAVYTDLGLLTDNDEIGEDATELFNFLTAYSQKNDFRRMLVAPINLRERMVKLIRRETLNAKKGLPARIIAKMNRLADVEIIRALYEASQAGVEIDLIVRGICMLRPGVKGLSENIRVRSIVGRLLEHSRVYCFANGGEEEVYIGSSDWMPRNLDRRVEVLAPVEDAEIKRFLKDEFLTAYLRDNVKASLLLPDGSYERITAAPGEEAFDSQLSFQVNSNVIRFDAKH
jgi:polyphosphate kinase